MIFSVSERTDRADARPIRRGGPSIEPSRPVVRAYIDLDDLAAWNAAQERAKAAYYGKSYRPSTNYAARTRASEKQQRYRARKKGADK